MTIVNITIDTSEPQQITTAIALVSFIKDHNDRLTKQAREAFAELSGMQYMGHVELPETYKPSTSVQDDALAEAAPAALADLWSRISPALQALLRAAAHFDGPYTTAQLAEALGTDVPTTRSWRANLGRSMNAVYRRHPDAPRFFEQHPQPEGGFHYSLAPVYRALLAGDEA